MGNITYTIFVNGIAAGIQIFFGFLYYVDHWKSAWSLRRRTALSFLGLAIFLFISGWILRNQTLVNRNSAFVDKNSLLVPLREIADSAYKSDDFNTTVKAAGLALSLQPTNEELLRMRARAYKRLGPQYYDDEIRDRKLAVVYNPDRQQNHLPIIEDYILQKKYDNAEAWIQQNANKITDHEVKLMFEFFSAVCQILNGEEHISAVKNLESDIRKSPLSKKFIENFWSSKYLMDFLNENPFPESSKRTIKDLNNLLLETAK